MADVSLVPRRIRPEASSVCLIHPRKSLVGFDRKRNQSARTSLFMRTVDALKRKSISVQRRKTNWISLHRENL